MPYLIAMALFDDSSPLVEVGQKRLAGKVFRLFAVAKLAVKIVVETAPVAVPKSAEGGGVTPSGALNVDHIRIGFGQPDGTSPIALGERGDVE